MLANYDNNENSKLNGAKKKGIIDPDKTVSRDQKP